MNSEKFQFRKKSGYRGYIKKITILLWLYLLKIGLREYNNLPITKDKHYTFVEIIEIYDGDYIRFLNDNNVMDTIKLEAYIPSRFRMLSDIREEKLLSLIG